MARKKNVDYNPASGSLTPQYKRKRTYGELR